MQKDTFQISVKKFLGLQKAKNTVLRAYVIEDLNGEEVAEKFYRKELQKQIRQSLELKK